MHSGTLSTLYRVSLADSLMMDCASCLILLGLALRSSHVVCSPGPAKGLSAVTAAAKYKETAGRQVFRRDARDTMEFAGTLLLKVLGTAAMGGLIYPERERRGSRDRPEMFGVLCDLKPWSTWGAGKSLSRYIKPAQDVLLQGARSESGNLNIIQFKIIQVDCDPLK